MSNKNTPRSENMHLVERSGAIFKEKETKLSQRPTSRSSSCGVQFKDINLKEQKERRVNNEFRVKLLKIQLEQQKDLKPLEKQMTKKEKEAMKLQLERIATIQEDKKSTFTPEVIKPDFVQDVYRKKAAEFYHNNKIAERMPLKRSSSHGLSEKDLVKSIQEDLKNGVPYESQHGYNYKVLNEAGLLDSKCSQNLSKSGYAAVSQIYEQAQKSRR